MKSMLIAAGLLTAASTAAHAQYSDDVVRIGVLSDMSSLYADGTGSGSVVAARLAVQDFQPEKMGLKVEVISADHQNKADIGATLANTWYDVDKVDMIVDVPNSAVALVASEISKQKNKVLLVSGAASSDLTGTKCSPNTVHWTYDTWNLASGTSRATVKTGGDTWFFITADYSFGMALERDATSFVEANGGKVLGKVRHPLNTQDFSSFLLQAQASKAKVIGLANAGGDTINVIKQANEFGITKAGQTIAGLLFNAVDAKSIGQQAAQGAVTTENWYWDMTDANRAFTRRWQAERPDKLPSMVHAGVYGAVTHYLKAVVALKSDKDGAAIVAKMKEMPTDDPLWGKGAIRADGRKIHPAYLFEVKKPEESKYMGDIFKLRAVIPAEEAFRPMKEGGCPLVKN